MQLGTRRDLLSCVRLVPDARMVLLLRDVDLLFICAQTCQHSNVDVALRQIARTLFDAFGQYFWKLSPDVEFGVLSTAFWNVFSPWRSFAKKTMLAIWTLARITTSEKSSLKLQLCRDVDFARQLIMGICGQSFFRDVWPKGQFGKLLSHTVGLEKTSDRYLTHLFLKPSAHRT